MFSNCSIKVILIFYFLYWSNIIEVNLEEIESANDIANDIVNVNTSVDKPKLLLLFSSISGVYQSKDLVDKLFKKKNVTTALYIPYAQTDYEMAMRFYSAPFREFGYELEGIHNKPDPIEAVKNAKVILMGGGNSFVLLKQLYDNKLIEPIREQVLKNGVPCIGSSAGSNVATRSIQTTNDMPVVYPPSFDALNFVPFNINPHYVDTVNRLAESRLDRIMRFLTYNNASVLGLRQSNVLLVEGNQMKLFGNEKAVLFSKTNDRTITDIEPETDLSYLLNV